MTVALNSRSEDLHRLLRAKFILQYPLPLSVSPCNGPATISRNPPRALVKRRGDAKFMTIALHAITGVSRSMEQRNRHHDRVVLTARLLRSFIPTYEDPGSVRVAWNMSGSTLSYIPRHFERQSA